MTLPGAMRKICLEITLLPLTELKYANLETIELHLAKRNQRYYNVLKILSILYSVKIYMIIFLQKWEFFGGKKKLFVILGDFLENYEEATFLRHCHCAGSFLQNAIQLTLLHYNSSADFSLANSLMCRQGTVCAFKR